MKLLGAMLLLGAGTLLGYHAAKRLDTRARHIRLLRQLLDTFMNELRSSLPLTADLLRKTAAQPAFAGLPFLQLAAADADRFPASWKDALLHDSSLDLDMRAVLETVGQTLGSTTLEGQLSALRLCQERLAVMQNDAEAIAKTRGSLYRSMGVLGAMFFVILLL